PASPHRPQDGTRRVRPEAVRRGPGGHVTTGAGAGAHLPEPAERPVGRPGRDPADLAAEGLGDADAEAGPEPARPGPGDPAPGGANARRAQRDRRLARSPGRPALAGGDLGDAVHARPAGRPGATQEA